MERREYEIGRKFFDDVAPNAVAMMIISLDTNGTPQMFKLANNYNLALMGVHVTEIVSGVISGRINVPVVVTRPEPVRNDELPKD